MSGKKGMGHRYWPKEIKLEAINRHLIAHVSMKVVANAEDVNEVINDYVKYYN